MSPVVKSSSLFLATAVLLLTVSFFGASLFAWLGGIQLLNIVAPRFPFARWVHWFHAMTFELLAFLGVALLRFIPSRESISGEGRPVLLVHGYMNHSSVWILQRKWLEALGIGPIYAIALGYPFLSIRHYAEKLKIKVEEIARQTGRRDLVLIGHSMGGLVSSWCAAKLATRGTVRDVITIASPLAGTLVARFGIGPNAREMEPNSEFLRELQNAMKEAKHIRFSHIATKSDQLVIPGTSAVIAENRHLILEDIGHASLLYSKRVANQIATWLKG